METQMISKRLKILSDLQEEINRIKALYQDSLENDPKYQELQEQSQKFRDESKEQRQKIKQNDTLKSMDDQLKRIRQDMKENKEALAQELADYYKDSGSMEITDADGNVKRFVFSVRLTDQKE
jgi:phosphosulfolactate synthase (CoM biosynthesis protein A)